MPDHETCTKLEVNQAVTNQRLSSLTEYITVELHEINNKINKLCYVCGVLAIIALGRDEALKILATFLK